MASITACMYSIIAALVKAEDILGPNRSWTAISDEQRRFLESYFTSGRSDLANIKEIESIASFKAADINTFLRERGFDIALENFQPPDFGTASVIDVMVAWAEKGQRTSLRSASTYEQHLAVRIEEKNRLALMYDSPTLSGVMVRLATQSAYTVSLFLPHTNCQPKDMFELMRMVTSVCRNESEFKTRVADSYSDVIFPMISINQKPNIDWLCGMSTIGTDGKPGTIGQALQQNKLRINEIGARAQSATALGLTRGMTFTEKERLVFDRPFYLWVDTTYNPLLVEKPSLSFPLFAAYVDEDAWKDPGSLDTK